MNLVDCWIIEIKDVTILNDKYQVLVKYIAEGVEDETYLSFDTLEECTNLKIGSKFLG